MENKPREFWIFSGDYRKGEYDAVDTSPLICTPEQVHVIEYAAYESLLLIIKRQQEALEFYGDIKRWSESKEGINDRINFDGDENFEDEFSCEQLTISGKKARATLAATKEELKKLGVVL